MQFTLPLALLAALTPTVRPDDRGRWAEQVCGVWVLSAVEADGVSTAGDKLKADALKTYPTYLALGRDGAFERTHANLAAVESDTGAFAVVTATGGVAQVDVSVRRTVSGDLPKAVDVRVSCQELWRLTDADTLQRCVPADAKGRPAEVGTARGDGRVLLTYTRFNPPAAEKK